MKNFKQRLGHVTDVQGLHICGYREDVVLYQDNRNGIGKQRKARLYTNGKGIYFSFDNQRVYVERVGC